MRDFLDRYPAGLRGALALAAIGAFFLLGDPARGGLREIAGRWLHILAVAWVVTLCAVPLVEWCALRVRAVDWPDRRKVHHRPTPRLGGVALFAGMAAALWSNGIVDPDVAAILIGAVVLFVMGMIEDIRGVSSRTRLIVQAGAALGLVACGMRFEVVPDSTVGAFAWNGFLTVVWIVGLTNAFRSFDGIDGLAAGLAVIQAVFLGAIAFVTGQSQLGWVSVAVIGACAGFLPYNFRPRGSAEIFLGDSGSTVLGFVLAALAVKGEWAAGHPFVNVSAPLLIFGVLIYDRIRTTVSRIESGRVRSVREWIEYTGTDHLHHRFEALLRSKVGSVGLIWLLSAALGLSAVAIRHVDLVVAFVLVLQCVAILVVVTILESAGNVHDRRGRDLGSPRDTDATDDGPELA